MRLWVPYADWPDALGLPDGVEVDVWDGTGQPPASPVELFVLPYMAGPGPARLMADPTPSQKPRNFTRPANPPGMRRNDGKRAIQNEGEVIERRPLSPWETYTQVLLISNEAAYVN